MRIEKGPKAFFENYLFAMSRVFLKNLGKRGRGE